MRKNDEKNRNFLGAEDSGLFGKIFLESIRRWLSSSGGPAFRGTKRQLSVLTEALAATRDFHRELNSPDALLEGMSAPLGRKRRAAAAFEATFGVAWPFILLLLVNVLLNGTAV